MNLTLFYFQRVMEVIWNVHINPSLICLKILLCIILSVYLGMFISELMIKRDAIEFIQEFLRLFGLNTQSMNQVRVRRYFTRRNILIFISFLIVCLSISLLYYFVIVEIYTVFEKSSFSNCPNV